MIAGIKATENVPELEAQILKAEQQKDIVVEEKKETQKSNNLALGKA